MQKNANAAWKQGAAGGARVNCNAGGGRGQSKYRPSGTVCRRPCPLPAALVHRRCMYIGRRGLGIHYCRDLEIFGGRGFVWVGGVGAAWSWRGTDACRCTRKKNFINGPKEDLFYGSSVLIYNGMQNVNTAWWDMYDYARNCAGQVTCVLFITQCFIQSCSRVVSVV